MNYFISIHTQNTSKETENKLNFINHVVLQIRALPQQKSHFSMSQLFKSKIPLVLASAILETLNMIQPRNTFSYRKYIYISAMSPIDLLIFFLLGFTPCKTEQHPRGMELQEKETQKIRPHRKAVQKDPKVKRCLLILDLKPLRL